jgi:hypothetical protein
VQSYTFLDEKPNISSSSLSKSVRFVWQSKMAVALFFQGVCFELSSLVTLGISQRKSSYVKRKDTSLELQPQVFSKET